MTSRTSLLPSARFTSWAGYSRVCWPTASTIRSASGRRASRSSSAVGYWRSSCSKPEGGVGLVVRCLDHGLPDCVREGLLAERRQGRLDAGSAVVVGDFVGAIPPLPPAGEGQRRRRRRAC